MKDASDDSDVEDLNKEMFDSYKQTLMRDLNKVVEKNKARIEEFKEFQKRQEKYLKKVQCLVSNYNSKLELKDISNQINEMFPSALGYN